MADEPEYTVELTAPDIAPYRAGNTGVPYVTRLDSGRPGPEVLVAAVVHGNELCGAIALDDLLRRGVRPLKGALTLAFCNVEAYLSFDPKRPGLSRFIDEDFNRTWDRETLDGPRQSVEVRRARELRPIVEAADYLLDIHSMQHRTPPLMICGPLEKGLRFARDVGVPDLLVCDEGHAAGRRMRDAFAFGDPARPNAALLVECGQHWERASAAIALETLYAFLAHLGLIGPELAETHRVHPVPAAQRVIAVGEAITIRTDRFRFAENFRGLEVIPHAGTVIGFDGDAPVRTPHDDCVLIMPSRRLHRGQTAVRLGRYVA